MPRHSRTFVALVAIVLAASAGADELGDRNPDAALRLAAHFARACPYVEPRADCERALVNIIASRAFATLADLSELSGEPRARAIDTIVHQWRQSEGAGVHVMD